MPYNPRKAVYKFSQWGPPPMVLWDYHLHFCQRDAEQKIVYRIEQMDRDVVALIDLGEQGALLTLSGQLRSTDHLISLEVSATDQGGLQGRCRVNIIVEDVNSPPYFTDQLFAVRIPEDSPIGFHVITIKAEDSDRGTNAHLTYFHRFT
ncbi:hypothetical protein COOONC_12063 [Cooperia oncophora]